MARREKKTIISCASIKYLRMPEVMMMIIVMVMIIEMDDNGESMHEGEERQFSGCSRRRMVRVEKKINKCQRERLMVGSIPNPIKYQNIHDDNNIIMKTDDMYKWRMCVGIEEVASRAQKKKGAEASEEDKYLGLRVYRIL